MSRHMAIVVCFAIVLMSYRHVTGQAHDVAKLDKRLTSIKSFVDREIIDIRFQISELKMTVEQMVVDQRNASAGSNIGGPFPDYGQGMAGVNQKQITDLKNKLNAHENRLNRLFSTVNEIHEVKNSSKRTAKADIEKKCDDRFNALQKKFEETAAAMMKGYNELKSHVNVKVSLFDQIHNLSQSVISEQNKLSTRIDQTDANIIRLDGEVNKLEVNEMVEKKERNEIIKNLKDELLQLNAGVKTKFDDRVNALQNRFEESTTANLAVYKDLESQISVQLKDLSKSLITEQNKLSVRINQSDANIVRLKDGLNTLDDFSRAIEGLKRRTDKCCIDCGDPTPEHGTVNTTVTKYGTVVKISCNHGYVLSGENIVKCNADSVWSDSATCNPYDCGDPTPDHGTVNTTVTTYGTVVKVSCNHGYVLSGENIVKCNADSVWSHSATCNPYDCGSAAPENGVASAPNGTTYQKQAIVQCNAGYRLNGSSVIECNATGWNDSVSCVIQRDCKDWYTSGFRDTGIYTIYPNPGVIFQVRCDMETDGGGWTVIQRRVSASDFYKSWAEYKAGFGDEQNFWLGNEKIFALTGSGDYRLRVDLTRVGGETRFASYKQFAVSGENDLYRLTIADYSGTAGDSLSDSNNKAFSAKDRDYDLYSINCAKLLRSAWWFNACGYADLNGSYGGDRNVEGLVSGLIWYHWLGMDESLASSEMKIRRR
ncbi:fibrinogen alpha-2 chain-like isoform X1 [Dreissena polymorpha]|uniref:Fibrinogen C-terminal domain-containing protein n=1 Tax=Dreissena polymorpha TaxID=45954 RepID=A0A9D4RJ26_DREPO|nr:fibrinogen alpha-2 chain-like isoform X1 [Dreissena polymorpha]KAH3869428.1 hypothetical protein DPMN_032593 [Dreissena polymorpha]